MPNRGRKKSVYPCIVSFRTSEETCQRLQDLLLEEGPRYGISDQGALLRLIVGERLERPADPGIIAVRLTLKIEEIMRRFMMTMLPPDLQVELARMFKEVDGESSQLYHDFAESIRQRQEQERLLRRQGTDV